MQKVWYSLLVIGIVTGIAAGSGTIAYFNDTETSTDNTFTAGTLDLKYWLDPGTKSYGDCQNGNGDTFALEKLAPGYSGYVKYKLQNHGNLDGYVEISSLSASHAEGANPDSETSDPDSGEANTMDEELMVLVWFDADDDGDVDTNEKLVYASGDGETIKAKAIEDLSGFESDSSIFLSAGSSTVLRANWNIPSTVGNDIQGDIATVSITFELAQTPGQ